MVRTFILFFLSTALVGCESLRHKAGLVRKLPNEYNVVSYKPLLLPSDLSLPSPTVRTDKEKPPFSRSCSISPSPIEIAFMRRLSEFRADKNIRQKINAEEKERNRDKTLQRSILFWKTPPKKGKTLAHDDVLHAKA